MSKFCCNFRNSQLTLNHRESNTYPGWLHGKRTTGRPRSWTRRTFWPRKLESPRGILWRRKLQLWKSKMLQRQRRFLSRWKWPPRKLLRPREPLWRRKFLRRRSLERAPPRRTPRPQGWRGWHPRVLTSALLEQQRGTWPRRRPSPRSPGRREQGGTWTSSPRQTWP